MAEYTSWVDNERLEADRTEEKIAEMREQALREMEAWPTCGRFSDSEENMLYVFSDLKMEKEFFEIGDAIIAKYPDPADDWYLSDTVYCRYAYHYLLNRQPKEALDWYKKALDNNLPYPQACWKSIAACYVELKDVPNADLWIEKIMQHDRERDKEGWLEWVDYAEYFNSTQRPERALSLCQLVLEKHKYPPMEIWYVMSDAYKQMGDFKNAIAMLQTYVDKFSYDEEGHHNLAMLVYEHEKDVPRVEALLLKTIEMVKDKPLYKNWVYGTYHNLTVVHLNEGLWDKAFDYLKSYFEWKYPPEEYDFFKQMIEGLPEIENENMAIDIYHILINFETSNLRPNNKLMLDGVAAGEPSEEVKDVDLRAFDISKLTGLDETQAN